MHYNYYANLFEKLKHSKSVTYKKVLNHKKSDGTVIANVLLVSSELIGTKPIYKPEMQYKFFEEVLHEQVV